MNLVFILVVKQIQVQMVDALVRNDDEGRRSLR